MIKMDKDIKITTYEKEKEKKNKNSSTATTNKPNNLLIVFLGLSMLVNLFVCGYLYFGKDLGDNPNLYMVDLLKVLGKNNNGEEMEDMKAILEGLVENQNKQRSFLKKLKNAVQYNVDEIKSTIEKEIKDNFEVMMIKVKRENDKIYHTFNYQLNQIASQMPSLRNIKEVMKSEIHQMITNEEYEKFLEEFLRKLIEQGQKKGKIAKKSDSWVENVVDFSDYKIIEESLKKNPEELQPHIRDKDIFNRNQKNEEDLISTKRTTSEEIDEDDSHLTDGTADDSDVKDDENGHDKATNVQFLSKDKRQALLEEQRKIQGTLEKIDKIIDFVNEGNQIKQNIMDKVKGNLVEGPARAPEATIPPTQPNSATSKQLDPKDSPFRSIVNKKETHFSAGKYNGLRKPILYVYTSNSFGYLDDLYSFLGQYLPISRIHTLLSADDLDHVEKIPSNYFVLYVNSESQENAYNATDYQLFLNKTNNNVVFMNLRFFEINFADFPPAYKNSDFSGILDGERVFLEFRHNNESFFRDIWNFEQYKKLKDLYKLVLDLELEKNKGKAPSKQVVSQKLPKKFSIFCFKEKEQRISTGKYRGLPKPVLYVYIQSGFFIYSMLQKDFQESEVLSFSSREEWRDLEKVFKHSFLLYISEEAQTNPINSDIYKHFLNVTEKNVVFMNVRSSEPNYDTLPKFKPELFSGLNVSNKIYKSSLEFRHINKTFHSDDWNYEQNKKLRRIFKVLLNQEIANRTLENYVVTESKPETTRKYKNVVERFELFRFENKKEPVFSSGKYKGMRKNVLYAYTQKSQNYNSLKNFIKFLNPDYSNTPEIFNIATQADWKSIETIDKNPFALFITEEAQTNTSQMDEATYEQLMEVTDHNIVFVNLRAATSNKWDLAKYKNEQFSGVFKMGLSIKGVFFEFRHSNGVFHDDDWNGAQLKDFDNFLMMVLNIDKYKPPEIVNPFRYKNNKEETVFTSGKYKGLSKPVLYVYGHHNFVLMMKLTNFLEDHLPVSGTHSLMFSDNWKGIKKLHKNTFVLFLYAEPQSVDSPPIDLEIYNRLQSETDNNVVFTSIRSTEPNNKNLAMFKPKLSSGVNMKGFHETYLEFRHFNESFHRDDWNFAEYNKLKNIFKIVMDLELEEKIKRDAEMD